MSLTTLCVCGTLLAFSSWIRAEEGPLLGNRGFRPCAASLRPVGACRLGQHDSTCPYLLSLPPLTVHLPRHLRELENIMQDLKKLKDSVDELRKMCADCTESRTERKCGGQSEREREKQIEGKSEDVGSGMNVRLEETVRGFKHERENDGEEVEKTDTDNSTEKARTLEWETDGKTSKEVVKDNEREEEDLREVGEWDRKIKIESTSDEDKLEQEKVPTAGGNTRTVGVTSEEVFETTHAETTDLLDALKGNLKGFQEDMLENEEEKKMFTNVKNKAKTKEDGDLYVRPDEINRTDKKTKTEASDRIKMSENHENREENINKEQEQLREEMRKEEGIKVDQNNEKLKHTESTGQTEKKKAIKEGEVDEKGTEMGTKIKTKSTQRNSDGALSWRKTTEGTDFLSISPTLISTTQLASKPDPNKVTIFTSSLPSPPLPSSTLSSIADVSRDTKYVYGQTPSTGLGAADVSEAESRDADLATRTTAPGGDRYKITSKTTEFNSAITVKPGAGLQGHERSTTTSPATTARHQKPNTTTSRVTDHRRWMPKKNISSNIKTGLKLPPGRVLRPGDKHKPGIKPEAEQKLKNPKNDRKPNQAPAPDKKPKYNQKQKPAPPRSTSEKPKPGKDLKNIHISKPDQKTTPPILATDKNWKTNLTNPSPQNKLPFHKQKPSVQNPASQRPQTVKTSHSDPSNNKKHVIDEISIDKNSKSKTRLVHSFPTNEPDQRETPEKKTENEEKSKFNEKLNKKQNLKPVLESDPKTNQTKSFTTKPKQQHLTESVKTSDEDPLQEPESISNVKPGQKTTSIVSSDQMKKSSHEIPETKRKLIQEPENIKSETATAKPNNKLLTENVKKSDENPLEDPESNLDLISGQKIILNQVNETSDQMNKYSQETSKIKPKPIKEPTSKTETAATKYNQKPSMESVIKSNKTIVQEPEYNPDLLSGQKTTSDQGNATNDQVNMSNQGTPKIKHQPKFKQWPKTHKSESDKLNPKQKPSTEDKSAGTPLQEPESNHKTFSIKPKTNQEPKPKTELATPKLDQNPSTESVFDENPLQEPESNQHLNNEQTITPSPVKAISGSKNKSSQEISRSKPKIKPKLTEGPTFKTETAATKPDQKPSAETVVNKNSVQESESDPDLLSRQKTTSGQGNATSDQVNTSNQEIPKIKHQPKFKQWPKTYKNESGKLSPKQKPLTEDKAAKNPLQEPESNQDLNNEQTITLSGVTATSDQMPESSQEIFNVKHKPKLNQELKPKIETGTPKPDYNASTEFEIDANPLQEPESSQEIFSVKHKTKPNQEFKPKTETATPEPDDNPSTESNENPFQEPESSQETFTNKYKPKPNQKPEPKTKTATQKPDQNHSTESDINENPLQEPESNQDLNYDQTITSTRVKTTSDQIPNSRQEIFNMKPKPKPNQESEPKTETATPKPVYNPSTESNENHFQEPDSNQDLKNEQTIRSSQVTATSDQMPNSSQDIFSTKHKPKSNQEPEPKTETATRKPDQNPSTESEVDETLLQKPESKQDVLPGQKITSDQVDRITDSNQDDFKIKHKPNHYKEPKSEKSETATLGPNRRFLKESAVKSEENPLQEPESNKESTSGQTHAADKAKKVPVQKFKPSDNAPIINKRPKPGPEPKQNQKHPKPVTSLKNKPNTNLHTERTPQTNTSFKTPRPDQNLKLKLFFKPKNISTANTNRTSKPRPPFQQRPLTRPWIKPGAKPIQRPKLPIRPKPSPKTKLRVDPPKISWAPPENIPNSQTDVPSTSGSATQTSEVTHTPGETDFSMRKAITLSPKTSDSLESEHSPHLHTHVEDFTLSPNSQIASDLRPQTASRPPSIPITTRSNKILRGKLQRVITSTNPGSTQPSLVPKSDFSAQDKILYNTEETAPANSIHSPSLETTSTPRPDFRSMTRSTFGSEPSAAEPTTPSARELRVKINQVAAFVNNSLNPKGGPGAGFPKQHLEGSQRGSGPDTKPTSVQTKVRRDCSDHLLRGETRSGVYLVTPDLRSSSFQVFCDMERDGGGWTLLQRRHDGSVSFNRTWAEYQSGFGVLDGGEFWLGNRMIHLLTRDRDMALRVELEDFEGVKEHAQYEQFRVAGERQHYKLTVGGYSGTAGDALRFSKRYDHNNRAFSTPDRDHDRYPSGNCGAYYSSGWWFDACMAANLNGKYYTGHYKGVRNGIFWGTWHNISKEYYPTNERQSFKTVRMMIRPKSFAP